MINIESKLRLIKTMRSDGKTIHCLVETPPVLTRTDTPLVLIVPPYAKTMRDVSTTSLFLTSNGFTTWRFDYSNHIGSSDGDIFDFTLSSAIEDVQTVVAATRKMYGELPFGIISSSLGSRIAFRALRGHEDVDVMVSLVGVVNLQHALSYIMDEDLIGAKVMKQLIPSSREVLGYEVSEQFINDVVTERLYSLDSTKQDVASCNFPIIQIAAELDLWTRLEEVEEVVRAKNNISPYELYLLKGASHKLENNPSAARDALRLTIQILKQYLCLEKVQSNEIICPSFAEIVKKIRQERVMEKCSYQSDKVEIAD